MTQPTQSRPTLRTDDTICQQTASPEREVEDACLQPFGNAGHAPNSRSDDKVMSAMWTFVNWSVAILFRGFAFQTAFYTAVQKRLFEPHDVSCMVTRTSSAPVLTVPVAKFVKNEVEKLYLQNFVMERHLNVSSNAAVTHKRKP